MKESPEDRAARKYVLKSIRGEGTARIELAPLTKTPPALPPTWRRALTDPHPAVAVLDILWEPVAKQYSRTIAAMRRTLQRVGMLTTTKRSHSIVYLFELEDEGGLQLRRGYLPSTKLPKIAARLPKDFLALYGVHDGWLDGHSMMGPRRSSEWGPLGLTGPSSEFLVTFEGHGPASLGFDLRKEPPRCYTVWTQSEPERVRNVAKEIDEWLAVRMDEYVPSRAEKPGRSAKPGVARKSSSAAKGTAKRRRRPAPTTPTRAGRA